MFCNEFYRLILLMFLVSTHQIMFTQDYDGDGVSNLNDLDDDNDGILDLNEGIICQVTNANFNQGNYGGNPPGWTGSGPGWRAGGPYPSYHPTNEGVGRTYLERDRENATLTHNTVINGVNEYAYIDVRLIIRENTFGGNTSYGNGGEIALDIYFGGVRYARVHSYEEEPYDFSPIIYYNGATGNKNRIRNGYMNGNPRLANYANSESFRIFLPNTVPNSGQLVLQYLPNYLNNAHVNGDDISIYSVCVMTAQDYDSDSIPDFLDLDSDGDGCPDAIEGNDNYLNSNMVASGLDGGNNTTNYTGFYYQGVDDNLGNNVDVNGVPNTDGNLSTDDSQSAGTSANIAINSCQQYINFDGVDDYIQAPKNFNLNQWKQATIQFWVKAESAVQNATGIVGQKGVLELNKNTSLNYQINDNEGLKSHTKTAWLDDANTWQHITIVYNDGNIKVYYNGELEHETSGTSGNALLSNTNTFNIGGNITSGTMSNYFHGWIDEVRVFDIALTESQLQQIIYQEIENNNGNVRGTIIPKDIKDFKTGNLLSWDNLKLYYKMGTDFTADGRLVDHSGNNNLGTLYNISTWQEETAPMPFTTVQDGNWEEASTWLHGNVWDTASGVNFPNLNNSKNANCAIIHLQHNVNLNYDNFYDASYINANLKEGLTQMGLIIDAGKTLTVVGDKHLENLSYLELNGTIDLQNDSQLIQTINSDLVTTSTGSLLRRQEGNSSVYWYNYWSSPVGSTSATVLTDNNTTTNNANNTNYNLSMLRQPNGSNFEFTNAYHEVGKISTYWLYTFKNGITYYDWNALTPSTPIEPGIGYTAKGTGVNTEQQYVFNGKPNNGTILVPVIDVGGNGSVPAVSKTDYLLGNPYPSALDIHKFIDDNAGIISGTLQLWQQWSGASHNLDQYNGGYAQVNKLGATRAYQFVGLEGATNGNQDGTKLPTRYLPVGQGFMVEITNNGTIQFNNSQRVFIKESDADGSYNNGSVFFRGNTTGQQKSVLDTEENSIQKLRLEFNSVDGPETKRELLLGFSEATTDAFDYGYDAINTDVYTNDLNLILDNNNYTIQAYSAITPDKVIPLALNSSGTYNYTIRATDLENLPEQQDIYIKDNLTNTYHNLRNETPYEFTCETGTFNNRLEIVFKEHSETLSQLNETIKDLNMYYAMGRKKIVILNPNNKHLQQINVINMLGQSVLTISNIHNNNYNEYSLQSLKTGNYIITLNTSSNMTLTKKIIIK